ncbi:DoxX-like family protein [Pedobacter psychrophilus]|uniref:DoxX-like family protein n=1 Tax=Pedobacter psychrophilus TaxID=1826909 RepID=A0A179DM04_9SPHI|nr:DoxX family protein [Pedobacter psychrophilus]OAQ41944.1 DoxX-like family protein [Pedobacter psychrophilus]
MENKKSKTIAFWTVTGFLCFGMTLGGSGQLYRASFNVDGIVHLGFPVYLLTIIGLWKILAVVAILIPKYLLLKEWAYSGLFFLLSGGVVSHFASGDGILEALPVFMFMCLTVISWYLRPADRRLIQLNPKN